MAPRKRWRKIVCNAAGTLPADLLLEIVARSDASTLVRCAAASKLLRRDILSPSFIRRVTDRQHGIVPGCLVAYVHAHDNSEKAPPPPPLSLVNPAMPAAASFLDRHLSPFVSRDAANLLADYQPVTSRGGLILLHRRRNINMRRRPGLLPDCLCVYDPMTGDRTFLSGPPDFSKIWLFLTYILLNATDGIGCAFKLVVVQVDNNYQDNRCNIRIQAATSSNSGGSNWGPVTYDRNIYLPPGIKDQHYTVLRHGGAIHLYWLGCDDDDDDEILMYDIHAERLDTVKLPSASISKGSHRCFQTSPDGELLLLVADGFMVSVWLQLQDGGWMQQAMINSKENLRLLVPEIPLDHVEIKFEESTRGERSSVVLLQICHCDHNLPDVLIVLDLETKEMHRQDLVSWMLLEIDMLSRLQAMKIYA